ncbi:MAG: 1-acyl-sn-glycerol-3-phosphate acyltransferase [Thermoanaerobaculia bacterium]
MRRALDALVGWLCRRLLLLFFRRVEVVRRDRLPERGPLVVVANHTNGLVDPMFVLGPLRLPARMLGKSTLWKIPVLAQILDLAGVLPVVRRQDTPGEAGERNRETFARCHQELARGGVVAIFPEGTSHDQPHLLPLRTGAARIALEAELERGPVGVRILPVGLVFEERGRFRSRALVVVGESLDPAPEIALARADEHAAVHALTARIAAALERVTLNYTSWREARLIEVGAEIFDRDTEAPAARRRLATEFHTRKALSTSFEELRRRFPAELEAAVAAAERYDGLLRTAGLTDEQVSSDVEWRPALAFAARTTLRICVASPLAIAGTLANLPPFALAALVARRVRDEPNQIATYKLFPSLVLYPATWIGEGVLAGWRFGAWAGLAAAVLAPISGFVALRWHERRATLWRESRAFLLLRTRRRVAREFRARRAAVAREIARLVDLWVASQGERGEPARGPVEGD